jgi:hypothetical protein
MRTKRASIATTLLLALVGAFGCGSTESGLLADASGSGVRSTIISGTDVSSSDVSSSDVSSSDASGWDASSSDAPSDLLDSDVGPGTTEAGRDATSAPDAEQDAAPRLDASPWVDDAGDAPSTATFCVPTPDGGIPAHSVLANGTITGSDIAAVFCNTVTRLYLSPYTMPQNQLLLFLFGSTAEGDTAFQRPPGAANAIVNGLLNVTAPAVGTYRSQDVSAGAGFGVSFGYTLPAPASLDCDAGSATSCPSGCGRGCPALGCDGIPCQPILPYFLYQSRSWTLTLTSVVALGDASAVTGAYYTPHGTLTATLDALGLDGGLDTATLSLSF